jgi:peptidoglycan/LPS O-acetylase OafA/YrhL
MMDAISPIFSLGYLWVDLFFLLSGFVMSHVYQSWFIHPDRSVGRFLWLRFSRIYPLFLLTLLCLIAWESWKASQGILFYGGPFFEQWGLNSKLAAFEGPINIWHALPSHLMLLQSLTSHSLNWNISAWSLSAEWLSYLCFPVLLMMLRNQTGLSRLVIPLCLITLVSISNQYGHLDVTGNGIGFLRGLASFSLGMSLFFSGWWRYAKLGHPALLLGALVLPVILMHFNPQGLAQLSVILAFALLILCCAAQKSHLQGCSSQLLDLLDNRLFRYLGDLSYSIYLWHVPMLLVLMEGLHAYSSELLVRWFDQQGALPFISFILIFLTLLLLLSSFSYHVIERPLQAWLRIKKAKANVTEKNKVLR